MNTFRQSLAVASLLAWLTLACTSVHGSTPATVVPGDSIYRLDLPLVDQDGRGSKLVDQRGSPVLIAMFYTSCQYTCPLIIDAIKRVEHDLGDTGSRHPRVLLVSFDSVRDTPQVLRAAADERHVDRTRWTLARTDASGVRKLAALLGVQYRALADGGFNHTSMITLLDAEGRIVAHSDRLGAADADFLAAIRKTLGEAR